ncbi:MAG: AbgT family transporter [Porticoccaceae bacterium]|jgi:aminobenzoyl-glutamate transport protein|nr:AbgT family transporter [Porticoccaceae bacterium]MEA3299820.1 AbgT family transporter [Pseudomonadota bacterium]HLS99605.1 AbgT family transporter [Porticoccaceae bacterium]
MTAPTLSHRALNRIEAIGNRLPHPTLLFVWLCGIVLVLSAIAALLGVEARHPVSGEQIRALNLLSGEGLRLILERTVSNFTQFAPLGTVLVAILGIGVAEHSGLIGTLLRASVLKAPDRLLTFLVVFAGVMSSIAADSGYVVLIPLAGIIFQAAGRSPIAGIAAAFAGVSGGFSANLLIGPLDAILAGLSTEAAALVDSTRTVSPAANYYFMVASTLLVAVVGTLVTERVILPRFGAASGPREAPQPISLDERRGLRGVGLFTLAFVTLLLAGLVPEQGVLRGQAPGGGPGGILDSPFINGIVTLIAVYAAVAGWLFGRLSRRFAGGSDAVMAMESSMATMASYLVLMFFAAQFVNYFAWSQLGIICAIEGAALLKALDPGATLLLVSFVLFAALINLLIGSSSAKWALLAPVFVPMLMLAGISPEATQVAYRIGDSSTNIITPLMPYFGVVVAFAQKYDRNAGIGTIIATMLPYSLWLLVAWSVLLAAWILLGLPLGPGAGIFMP